MSNVIQLFQQKRVAFDPKADATAAVAELLASSAQLGLTVKELSRRLDAVDRAVDAIDDVEVRSQLMQTSSVSRDALSKAMLRLTLEISKLPKLQVRINL